MASARESRADVGAAGGAAVRAGPTQASDAPASGDSGDSGDPPGPDPLVLANLLTHNDEGASPAPPPRAAPDAGAEAALVAGMLKLLGSHIAGDASARIHPLVEENRAMAAERAQLRDDLAEARAAIARMAVEHAAQLMACDMAAAARLAESQHALERATADHREQLRTHEDAATARLADARHALDRATADHRDQLRTHEAEAAARLADARHALVECEKQLRRRDDAIEEVKARKAEAERALEEATERHVEVRRQHELALSAQARDALLRLGLERSRTKRMVTEEVEEAETARRDMGAREAKWHAQLTDALAQRDDARVEVGFTMRSSAESVCMPRDELVKKSSRKKASNMKSACNRSRKTGK